MSSYFFCVYQFLVFLPVYHMYNLSSSWAIFVMTGGNESWYMDPTKHDKRTDASMLSLYVRWKASTPNESKWEHDVTQWHTSIFRPMDLLYELRGSPVGHFLHFANSTSSTWNWIKYIISLIGILFVRATETYVIYDFLANNFFIFFWKIVITNNFFPHKKWPQSSNEDEHRWYTVSPWTCPQRTLPKNDQMELQSLLLLEHRLSQDPEMVQNFCNQIKDMENRGTSAVLSKQALESWKGRLLLLATGVKGKISGYGWASKQLVPWVDTRQWTSVCTRVRSVSSTTLWQLGLFLMWWISPSSMTSMDTSVEPFVHELSVNNFGVNCVATSALQKSADHSKDIY